MSPCSLSPVNVFAIFQNRMWPIPLVVKNPSLAGWSRVGENPAARDGRPDRVPARVASHRDAAWSASIAFVAMTTHSASRVMHDTAASSSNARLSGARIPSAGF